MTKTRGISGVVMLCALAVFALAAPSAFAAKGTTAFTCAKAETGAQFSDAHCTKAGSGAGYKHVAIAAGEKTSVLLTNKGTQNETKESTPAVFQIRLGAMEAEIKCLGVSGEGTLTNDAGPPMGTSGTMAITYSECALIAPLTFPGCLVENSTISSSTTFSTPTEGMSVAFAGPGELIASFRLTKCTSSAFNTEFKITGSYTAVPIGATWETTVESTKGLKSTAQQASLTSKTTVKSATETGIALTTTES